MPLIAAIDPQGGGTWLAVNQSGLCVFLLNNYGAIGSQAQPLERTRSRGELPLKYAAYAKRSTAARTLRDEDFADYLPFLIALADTDGAELYAWDGELFERVPSVDGFVTTSSYRTAEVQAYRNQLHDALGGGSGSLSPERRRQLHLSTAHSDPAFNPLMLREESRTQSVATVEVGPEEVRYAYEVVQGETRTLGGAVRISLKRSLD